MKIAQVTNLICPPLFFYYFTEQKSILMPVCTAFFYNFPLQMKSEEEEKARPATKEEEDINVLRSWMEVGGLPAHPEEEAKELLTEVNLSPVFPMLPSSISYLLLIPPSQS